MEKKQNVIPNNAIVLDGKIYKVIRTNNIAGLGPNPCSLCDPGMKRRCLRVDSLDVEPCRIFNKGHFLAHFKKIS